MIAGRSASQFEMATDGTEIVRVVDPASPVTLGIDVPDSTRWNLKWADPRQFILRNALSIRLPAPAKTELTCTSAGVEGGLPNWQCELQASGGNLRVPLRTDELGIVRCTLPRLQYGVYVDGSHVGDLDFHTPSPRVTVPVRGQGVIRGHYAGSIPSDGARLELRIENDDPVLGDFRREGEFVSRPLTTSAWAVAVPWPTGAQVRMRLWRARRPLGPSASATVGDQGVSLPYTDEALGRTVRD